MRILKILGLGLLGLLAIAAVIYFFVAPPVLDSQFNTVDKPGPYQVTDRTKALYHGLQIVDLHADPLLWDRDLSQRNMRGQVDLPRMRDANMALQVFGLVTKVPAGLNFDRNSSDSDVLPWVVAAQRWPVETWFGLKARALYEITKAEKLAQENDDFTLIKSRSDLDQLLAARARGEKQMGGLIAFEGIQPIEGEIGNLDLFFDRGVRMVGLTHFFDNEAGGSAHGWTKGGLTTLGIKAVRKLEALNIAIDLAHASPKLIDDVLAIATRPVVVSHTGVKATCPGPRNLSDDQIRRIASTGGVLGIGFFEGAVCGKSPSHIADAMMHVIDLVGASHVALGSDFDGAVSTQFDITGLPLIAEELLARGVSEADIARIFGQNALRVLRTLLPEG